MKLLTALACASTIACTVPYTPTPVGPVGFRSKHTVPEVAQIAAQELTIAGFTITQSDATNGIIAAHRDRMKSGNSDLAECKFSEGSTGANVMETDLRVSVIALSVKEGSDVRIYGDVRTTYPGMPMLQASDRDCVSRGIMEKRIADAVR